jgi:hypothetical protein
MSRAIDIIKASNDQISKAGAPDILRARFAGEIDFAYKFGLISFAERDQMLSMQATTCKDRRETLKATKLKRLGISQ